MDLLTKLHTDPFVLIHKRLEDITTDIDLLDEVELVRHDRYLDPEKKIEFLAGRCLIKEVLGELLGRPPDTINLSMTESGKPYYKQEGEELVHFNLSHTQKDFTLGVSLKPIGVDMEPEKDNISLDSMRTFLADDELQQLKSMPDSEQSNQVLKLFTAKEAFIKATDKRYGLDEIVFKCTNGCWDLKAPTCDCLIEHSTYESFFVAVSVDLD
ncbi:MAG: 4'-phosphopantetheinyl transferase superfamily protein [Flavobacteriales bacterium]|nr:4'-phosphopantetheinyl transferase superfamily protein [Flavobacteriales bacterium]